jgi:hypothetical protein
MAYKRCSKDLKRLAFEEKGMRTHFYLRLPIPRQIRMKLPPVSKSIGLTPEDEGGPYFLEIQL